MSDHPFQLAIEDVAETVSRQCAELSAERRHEKMVLARGGLQSRVLGSSSTSRESAGGDLPQQRGECGHSIAKPS